MEARRIRSEEDARRCLAQVEASGHPRAAWARSHGVCARSLNAWRINLERAGRRPELHLVELVASSLPPKRAAVYRIRCGVFEVETAGDFDDAVLRCLLRVVASC